MAKKNSTAPKSAMIFNSVLMINTENVVYLVNSLPKSRMSEDSFNSYMKKNFYFGGKFHGNDFNNGSHYSTVVRQLGLYHILDNEYIPRFYSNINEEEAESYLKYWLKLYVAPNPTSQASFRKSVVAPKYLLKELISFIEKNPTKKNIYDIVDEIFTQKFSRNDKGNLPDIIKKYSECIEVDKNSNVSLKANYKQVMMDINELINNPNRYFDHFGGSKKTPLINLNGEPLQRIFYGAPGTGKSHEIKRLTKGKSVIRTTFHPDSDYSTFVGAYKPVMEDVDVQVVPVVLNKSGIGFDENKGTYKERHIEYKFVKQAFLKAYLAAWKKYTEPKILPISFGTGTSGRWFIMSVGPHVSAKKTLMPLKDFEEKIKEVWNNQSLDLWNNANDNVINEDAWVEKACCDAVFDSSNATTDGPWKDIEKALNAEDGISVKHDGQDYKIKNENGNVVITIDVDKESIRKSFDNKDEESNSNNPLQKSIAGRIRNFSDNFDKAWSGLVKGVNENNVEPQFLIIEEINRGNCAQIFGDIFQLLDRSENCFSTYPIEADSDIKDEIARAFREDEEYKLSSDISIEGMVDGYTSNYGETLSEDVQEGRILLLPPNLYIWATMNTSDQSLFPIDSAFKRRWDWKYMPISNNNYNWIIEIGDKKYKWVDFQKEINNRIYDIDNSEDKQLGDYFVNANRTDNKISSYTLLNKILFYLWNDVCKDEPDLIFSWKDDSDGGKEKSIKFSEFFCDEKERDRKLQGLMSFLNINAIVE